MLKSRSILRRLFSLTSLLSHSASSSRLCITSSEEDLRKATAVTQQTKALISRKPLPLPVVLERGEERGKSDSGPRFLSSLCRLGDKRRDKAQGEIIFRAGPISRAIEERKWGRSLGGLGSSHEGRSILFLAAGLAPWIYVLVGRNRCWPSPGQCSSTSLFKANQMGLRRDVDEA